MKKRIILIFTAVTLAILSLVIIVLGFKLTEIINTNLEKDQKTIASEAAYAVTEKIRKTWAVLDLIAKDEVISKGSEYPEKTISVLNHIKNSTEFLNVGYVDTNGKLLRYDGKVVDVKDREYFQKAIQGKHYISSPTTSKTTDDLVVFYSVPIENNGKVEGVVMASIAAEELVNLVDDIKIGKTGYALILDAKGNYVSHIDKSLVNDQKNALEQIGDTELLELFKDAVKGNIGCGDYSINGIKKYLSYTPIDETDWTMFITIEQDEIYEGVNKVLKILIILGVFGGIITLIVAFWIGGAIANPIKKLNIAAGQIAAGDFTTEIDNKLLHRKDELGMLSNSFYNMNNKLSQLLSNVKDILVAVEDGAVKIKGSSDNVKTSAEETSRTVEAIAIGAQDQAKQTEQGVISVNDLAKIIEKIYKTVENTASSTTIMNEEASEGLNLVGNLIDQTNNLQESMNKVDIVIKETNESSNNIGNASKAISEISDQTNLLALNAAIEAARAGEAGKGFAVVADEIRKLSEQSNESTKDINKALEELQNNSRISVKTIELLLGIVEEQIKVVKDTENKYNNIAAIIESVVNQMDELSNEAASVGTMKNTVVEVLETLSAVAEENAASTEETLAISEEQKTMAITTLEQSNFLVEKVHELQTQVDKFKIK
jgi:methyl-accepting chemotaxis protein